MVPRHRLVSIVECFTVLFLFLKENHSGNPVDVINYFHSARTTGQDKFGFELVYARPLRTFVEVNKTNVQFSWDLFLFSKNNNHFIYVICLKKLLNKMIIRLFKIFLINNNIRKMVFYVTRKSLGLVSSQQAASIQLKFVDRKKKQKLQNIIFRIHQEFVESLNLQSNQTVLDVGCGIGGGDIFMSKV